MSLPHLGQAFLSYHSDPQFEGKSHHMDVMVLGHVGDIEHLLEHTS